MVSHATLLRDQGHVFINVSKFQRKFILSVHVRNSIMISILKSKSLKNSYKEKEKPHRHAHANIFWKDKY